MLICVTKFCFLHWLDYSMVFGSREYRLSPRRPLGKLTTQPFPINELGESSGASSHESLAKNCLPPPRKDSFLKEGYSEGSDGGRDTTWSGSNIRNSQTDGCWRYVTFTTSWTSQLYIEKIFFQGPTVDPPALESPVITGHRRWVMRSAFKKAWKHSCTCLHWRTCSVYLQVTEHWHSFYAEGKTPF